MVKYQNLLIDNLVQEWKSDFIAYPLIKKELNIIQIKQKKEMNPNNQELIKSKDISTLHLYNINDHESKIPKNLNSELNFEEVIKLFNREIIKFNEFYHNLENELLTKLNNHLGKNEDYHKYSLQKIHEEFYKLMDVLHLLFNISKYVYVNTTAMRKLLKKVNRKIIFTDKILSNLNSFFQKENRFTYVLLYKVINETLTKIDEKFKLLESLFKEKYMNVTKYNFDEVTPNIEIGFPRDNSRELNTSEDIQNFFKNNFNYGRSHLDVVISNIQNIEHNVEIWVNTIKTILKRIHSESSNLKSEITDNSGKNEEGDQLENDNPSYFSTINWNIWITLIHTFIYSMNVYIAQPTNSAYLKSMQSSPFLSGLIMGMTHLAAFISTFIYSFWTNSSYKIPLTFSIFSFIFGNLLYSIAFNFQSVILMGLGRFLIGFGGARVVNRRYLIEQVSKSEILFYSFLYVLVTCIGMSVGPLLAIWLSEFEDSKYLFLNFNAFTNPGWFCIVVWMTFFFLLFFLFKDKQNEKILPKEDADKIQDRNQDECAQLDDQDFIVNSHNQSKVIEGNNAPSNKKIVIILIGVLVLSRMMNECLMVMAPIMLPNDYLWSMKKISLFLSLTALLVLPFFFLFEYLSKRYKERDLIISMIIIITFSSMFLVDLFISLPVMQFTTVYTILFLSSNILDSVSSALIAKFSMNDPEFQGKFLNSGFIIILSVTTGRFVGSISVSIFGLFGYELIQSTTFLFYSVVYGIAYYFCYKNYYSLIHNDQRKND